MSNADTQKREGSGYIMWNDLVCYGCNKSLNAEMEPIIRQEARVLIRGLNDRFIVDEILCIDCWIDNMKGRKKC